MEKYVGLNPAWFEPGVDGIPPFTKLFDDCNGSFGESISAAFRALLAGEDCGHTVDAKDAEIARLRVEVERLKNECSDQQRYVLDLESAIARKETRIKVLEVANDSLTQYSSNLTAERDALQEQVEAWQDATGLVGIYSNGSEGDPGDVTPEMLSKHLDELRSKASELDKVLAVLMEAHLDPDVASMAQIGIPSQVANWITVCQNLRTRYDALRARIDAGVPVYSATGELWSTNHKWSQFTKLLIDAHPIAEADERKGERRAGKERACTCRCGGWRLDHKVGDESSPNRRISDRRRTAGTIADRKEA